MSEIQGCTFNCTWEIGDKKNNFINIFQFYGEAGDYCFVRRYLEEMGEKNPKDFVEIKKK